MTGELVAENASNLNAKFKMQNADSSEWRREFEAAAARPLATRLRYAFIRTYKPVLDDAPYRAFTTMKEYREWCDERLPSWLGYGRV